MERIGSIFTSIRKKPLSPTKSCSTTRTLFLTKDSNLTTFTVWDVDGRLGEIETHFKTMKDALEGTMSDRKTLEEAIGLAKKRGMSLLG